MVKKNYNYLHDFVMAGAEKEKVRALDLGLGNT